MEPTVKVCGARAPADVDACVRAGVDYVGFNFAPGSKRRVDAETARELVARLGHDGPAAVGVFRDQMPGDVMRIARSVPLQAVQLHGDEPPAYCSALGGFAIWKALRGPDVDRATLEAFAAWCDLLIVDGRDAGSGAAWPWDRLAGMLDDDGTVLGVPVLLAGGLTPDNVADALQRSGASGVDVASGIETNGAVDADKVTAFVAAARGAIR